MGQQTKTKTFSEIDLAKTVNSYLIKSTTEKDVSLRFKGFFMEKQVCTGCW